MQVFYLATASIKKMYSEERQDPWEACMPASGEMEHP